jgi:copper resistance protein D
LDPLVIARAVHIASTAMVAGAIFFQSFVLAPAFRSYAHPAAASVSRRVKTLVWFALPVAVLSGLAWLLLLAARIADQGVIEAFAGGIAWSVLINTRFGHDWIVRLGLALFLTATFRRPGGLHATWQDRVSPLVAAALLGSIAWSDHAGASPAVTGIINTSNLAGTVPALVDTEYGRLLLLKISIFIAILGPAAVNRLWLLPRLPATDAVRQLRRNVLLEIGLATAIVLIVGALGTMPPGEHSAPHIH